MAPSGRGRASMKSDSYVVRIRNVRVHAVSITSGLSCPAIRRRDRFEVCPQDRGYVYTKPAD